VALSGVLIVPVIHNADEKSFLGLTRAVNDLAAGPAGRNYLWMTCRVARSPLLILERPARCSTRDHQPAQVGIVRVGGVTKTPGHHDAICDSLDRALSLSYDHRIIDGYVADSSWRRETVSETGREPYCKFRDRKQNRDLEESALDMRERTSLASVALPHGKGDSETLCNDLNSRD